MPKGGYPLASLGMRCASCMELERFLDDVVHVRHYVIDSRFHKCHMDSGYKAHCNFSIFGLDEQYCTSQRIAASAIGALVNG
jgi:hypothetical protein